MTTSWTQADVEALEAAIKSGRLRVRFGDREVEYNSASEMLKVLQTMKDAVEMASSSPKSRTSYAYFRKSRNRPSFGDE